LRNTGILTTTAGLGLEEERGEGGKREKCHNEMEYSINITHAKSKLDE
jgi:hypothetical protein